MSKLYAGKNYIIGIEEFMRVYVGKSYDGNNKLTHSEMIYYLREKQIYNLKKIPFKDVKNEDILNGSVILVKDKSCKTVCYINPLRMTTSQLLRELNSKKNVLQAKKVRNEYLKSLGLVDVNGKIINEEDLEKNEERYMDNRTKKLINKYGYRMRRAI